MTTPHDAIVTLSRALDQAGDTIARTRTDQYADPTPCEDWDVGRLLGHLVAAPRNFLTRVEGGDVDWSAAAEVSIDPAADFRSAADDLIHYWHQVPDSEAAGADMQTAEFAVHTWDLARATKQDAYLDPTVAERALALLSSALTDENRGSVFGPPVPVSDDAPVYERLAAFAGRRP